MAQSKSVTAYLRAKDAGFSNVFKKASSMFSQFKSGSQSAGGASKSFTSGIKGIVTSLGIYKAAQMAVTTVTGQFKSALGRMDTMSGFTRTMGVLGKTTEETTRTMDGLKAGTKGTAYGLDVATKAAQNFITRGMDSSAAVSSVNIWMDAVSTFGKGTNEEFASVSDALAKMRTKGKVEMDQLNRLFDVGIDAVGMYAKATGRASADVQKDLSDGKITTEEFLDVVETAMREGTNGVTKLAGAAKKAGAEWEGSIDNMKAAITRGVVTMVEKFDQLTKKLTGTDLKGWIAEIGAFFENNLGKIADAIGWVVDQAMPYIEVLKQGFNEIKGPIKGAIDAVKDSLQGLYEGFDHAGAVDRFREAVQMAAEKIQQFSQYVEENSDKIALIISKAPQAVAALMAFRTIQSVTGVLAEFGSKITNVIGTALDVGAGLDKKWKSNILTPLSNAIGSSMGSLKPPLDKFKQNFKFSMDVLSQYDDKGAFRNFTRSIAESLSSLFPSFDLFRANFRKMDTDLISFTSKGHAQISTLQRFQAALEATTGGFRGVGNAVLHPISSLKMLGTNLAATSAAAGGSATVMGGVALKVSGAFKTMAAGGIGAIKGLTAAMLSNPITALLVALAAAVVFVAASWKSNFMNIQGVVKSFGAGVKNSITSLKDMFKGMDGVVKPVITVFKTLGAILTGALGIAIANIVDNFRLMVFAINTVVRGFIILGQSAKMVAKAFKGDWKGASKEFDKVKDQLGQIGDNFQNLKDNSATKAVVTSMKEWGKETDKTKEKAEELKKSYIKTADSIIKANTEAMKKIAETNAKLSEVGQNMKSAFEVEGSTEKMKQYGQASFEIVERFAKKKTEVTDKYNQMMMDSEQASGNKKVELVRKASQYMLSTSAKAGDDLLTLYQTNKEMLVSNKTAEGIELSAEQRKAIQEQNNAIREGLIEQQQLYVDAAMQKRQLGEELSQNEIAATKANLTALNRNHIEALNENNEQIKALEQANQVEQDAVAKANNEAKIATLRAHNETVTQEMAQNAATQLEMMSEQDQLKVDKMLETMNLMGITTQEGLAQVFQHYVQLGASTEEQMTLMGVMLQSKGVEGSQALIDALQSGDKAAVGAAMSEQVIQGISGLPESLFVNGASGRDQFIAALKSGDIAGAGKYLVDQAGQGAKGGNPQMDATGKGSGDSYKSGVDSKASDANNAGKKIAKSAADGEKSQNPSHKSAGADSGSQYVFGVNSKNHSASVAGRSLSTNAKAGASSISLYSVGSALAQGVADGISGNTGSAVAAMASLVSQVNAEAKKVAKVNSPSKLLRDGVGKALPEGVAVGIKQNTKMAIYEAGQMIQSIQGAISGSSARMNILTDGDSTLTVKDETQSGYVDRLISKVDELIQTVKDHSGPDILQPVVELDGRKVSKGLLGDLDTERSKNELIQAIIKGERR